MSDSLLKALARILPADRILSQPDQLKRYQKDLVSAEMVMPLAAVVPETKQQVVEVVRVCHGLRIPFLARGAGSSLSGGALPLADGILIHLKDLNHILQIDPRSRLAVVEPGVINQHVTDAAAEHSLYYAPDPSSQSFCTIGGNVAFNSGGVHCLRYGMTANHVLGIEAVLADGELVKLGSQSLESAGPDLTGLFVGSEGLFGVALEVTLRLIPQVEARSTVMAAYKTLEQAGDTVSTVVASGLLPGALEIMDPLAIQVTESVSHAGYPMDAGALVIVELEGERAELELQFAQLLQIIKSSGAYQVRTATDDEERAAIWKGRKAAFTAIRKVSKNYIIQDGVVPRRRLGEALGEIERLSRKFEIPVANVFHAGDGNLHPLILYQAEGCNADRDRAEVLAGEIVRICIDMGGSITGEHGVGLEKRDYLPLMYPGEGIALMHRLRRAMDPETIANPGKMLLLGQSRDQRSAAEKSPEQEPPVSRVPVPEPDSVLEPANVDQVVEAVRSSDSILPIGAGTKPALTAADGASVLKTGGLTGIKEYIPQEFTFTARAGTPVGEIAEALAENGQYLPFDPLLVRAGSTIGGAVAAGASGPGSYRYGGIRTFILGASFVDGEGRLIATGGQVVKNAAGFDFPKLMVGSLGGLGILTEVTFKVFPEALATETSRVRFPSLHDAVSAVAQLGRTPLSIEALEILALPNGAQLMVRMSGSRELLAGKMKELENLVGEGERVAGETEQQFWADAREMSWAKEAVFLVRVPVVPSRIMELDGIASSMGLDARYGIGGNVAWLSSTEDAPDLVIRIDSALSGVDLAGVVVRGTSGGPLLGKPSGPAFRERVKAVLDPKKRFRAY